MKTFISILFTILAFSSSLFSQLVPDFRVNDDTTNFSQTAARVDTDAEGNFVIVWEDRRTPGMTSVYCQIYNSSAQPIGSNFLISQPTKSGRYPDICIRDDGSFIVCWLFTYVYAQMFNALGVPISEIITVSDSSSVSNSKISKSENGNFVISWEQSGFNPRIYFQRLDAFGNKIGGNVKVTDYPYNHTQRNPAITVRDDGSFIITWTDSRPPVLLAGDNIYMQMYDSSSIPVGANTMVNDSADWRDIYYNPRISHSDSNFIIAFTHDNFHSNSYSSKFQIYDSDGNKIGTNKAIPIVANSSIAGISMEKNGYTVIAFFMQWGLSSLSYFQRVEPNGNFIGNPYLLTQSGLLARAAYNEIKLFENRIISVWQDLRNGNEDIYCNIRSFTNPDSTVGINQMSTEVAEEFMLFQNYPNPFNPVTVIRFSVPNVKGQRSNVKLVIYNSLGQEMEILLNQALEAGEYEYVFNRSRLSSGIYFYSLITENKILTKKMMIIK
jgi:hypothetical protein